MKPTRRSFRRLPKPPEGRSTWVSAGTVRVELIAAADPLVQDAVITGHDRDEVGALFFLGGQPRT